jgi:hypothetical protein
MKVSHDGKNTELQTTASSSRRKFLVKTSAGVVITTLPAHSVWGACNASGLSGGSRSAGVVCIIPDVSGGRSPGSWKMYISAPNVNVQRNKVREMFSMGQGASNTEKDVAICAVYNFIDSLSPIVLSDGSGSIPSATLDIKTALETGGNYSNGIWNLAAYYLNAYFGFYGDISPFTSAEEMVQHVWSVLYINNNNSTPTNFDILLSAFTDGSVATSNLPSSAGC